MCSRDSRRGQIWTPIPRLRGSTLHAETQAKDYERLVETSEMLLYLAMSRILLRRLTRKER